VQFERIYGHSCLEERQNIENSDLFADFKDQWGRSKYTRYLLYLVDPLVLGIGGPSSSAEQYRGPDAVLV